jgi:hypothetical protein
LVLKSIGFKEKKSDTCLLSIWHEDGVMLSGIYMDDCLVIGTEERIDKLIADLKKNGFNSKVENNLEDYLSCCVIETKNLNQITTFTAIFNQQFPLDKFGKELDTLLQVS